MPFKTRVGILFAAVLVCAASQAPMDAVKGVPLASRISCDGSTNYQDEVTLQTTFSPGGLERSFQVAEFQPEYCKHVDLYFVCLKRGHNRWREDWSADSSQPAGTGRVWLNSCSSWGSKEAAQYILSGWYREGTDRKQPWKQVVIKRVSEKPEIYEFTDPNGGSARVEVTRK